MVTARVDDLFPDVQNPESIRVLNDRCLLRIEDRHCVVIVSGVVLAQYALSDRMAEAYAMVSLIEQGWADQNDVARAFRCSARATSVGSNQEAWPRWVRAADFRKVAAASGPREPNGSSG